MSRGLMVGALLSGVLLLQEPGNAEMTLAAGGSLYTVPVRTMRDMPFRTVIRQQFDYSCGSAALATLLTFHYDQPTDESTVFRAMYAAGDQAQIRKVGFSLLDMKKYLAARGLQADGFKIRMDELSGLSTPAVTVIAAGEYKHFAIIKGIDAREVLLGDPALGLRHMPRDTFAKIWSGIILIIRDSPDRAAFNARQDWDQVARPPWQAKLDEGALAASNLGFPTIYQIIQTTPMQPDP